MHDLLFSCNIENYGMYNRQLARAIGLFPAIILQELIACRRTHIKHLINHRKHGCGWFWATIDQIAMETGMDDKEQNRALRKLKKLGLIDFQVFGIPTRRHFRIDVSKVIEVLKIAEDDGYSKPQNIELEPEDGFYEERGYVKQNDELIFYGNDGKKPRKVYQNEVKNIPFSRSAEILQREIDHFSRDDSNIDSPLLKNEQKESFSEEKSRFASNSQRGSTPISRDESKSVSTIQKQGFKKVLGGEGSIRSLLGSQCYNYKIYNIESNVNEKEILTTIRTEAIASSPSFTFGSSSLFQAKPKENPHINLELQKPMSQQKESQVSKPQSKSNDKKVYGSENNVMLTEAQHLKLLEKMSVTERDYLIESLSLYGCQIGEKTFKKKYVCHYATLLNWQRRDIKSKTGPDGKDQSKIARHRRGSSMVTAGDYDECTYQPREFRA